MGSREAWWEENWVGTPEPWALVLAPVLAPTLTSLGRSMNWVCWDWVA